MPSIFSRIVAGEIPAHKIREDDSTLSFLDLRPVQPGHTLVIPKREVEYLFDLDPDGHRKLWDAAHETARLLKRATGCKRVCVAVLGYEVPHAHVHLIPTNHMRDFPWPGGREASQDELKAMAERIRAGAEP